LLDIIALHVKHFIQSTIQTTLSDEEEYIVTELRKSLLLTLDDLLVVARRYINPKLSRSALDRCLRRNNLTPLSKLIPKDGDGKPEKKTFKDYLPGYVHIDIKYLPQMADQDSRSYLLVAIDRATRWVYMEIHPDKTASSASSFVDNMIKKCPIKITKILTDNGKEFTDKYRPSGDKKPTGKHLFDKTCTQNNIEHRLTKPFTPKTNGMVERFNGRISGIVKTTKFSSFEELESTMKHYMAVYNTHLCQRSIGHITPMSKLKSYYKTNPECFRVRPYNHTGLDT
jgi:transposase InsO family protein